MAMDRINTNSWLATVHRKKLAGEKLQIMHMIMSHSPKFSSPIFTDTPKLYLAYALTVAYSPNFSLPIAFICMACQIFPVHSN